QASAPQDCALTQRHQTTHETSKSQPPPSEVALTSRVTPRRDVPSRGPNHRRRPSSERLPAKRDEQRPEEGSAKRRTECDDPVMRSVGLRGCRVRVTQRL